METTTKICTKCNTQKSITEFYTKDKNKRLSSQCKECENKKRKLRIKKSNKTLTEKQKEEFYKRIGSNVARIRKKHKLSQLKLSLLIGHKSTSLLAGAEIYYNKQHFSLEHLANISFVLNEDITEFFK